MPRRSILALLLVLPALAVCTQHPADSLLAHTGDYTFGYYPHGWRGTDSKGDRIFAIQTNRYALTLNTTSGRVERVGALVRSLPASDAVSEANRVLEKLPVLDLLCEVRVDGVTYSVAGGAPKPDDVILQRLGRYLQHVQVRGLTLRTKDGSKPAGVQAWLEVYGWSDRVSVLFHIESLEDGKRVQPAIRLPEDARISGQGESAFALMQQESGAGLAFLDPLPATQNLSYEAETTVVRALERDLQAGTAAQVAIAIIPDASSPKEAGEREAWAIRAFGGDPAIRANGITPYTGPLHITYDAAVGWHRIVLGENPDINVMERVQLELTNDTETLQTVRLCFAKEVGSFGITGMSPLLRDEAGLPLGVPVQISKNWHVRPPWFTGLTIVDLTPGVTNEFEFDLAYASWGTGPAISHAQLCLEGWGTNQQWDQMAIGSFGESICYDPDINLNRGMIDDMRPLMVWGMGQEPKKQWSWTHNVGGGDFLVVFKNGERQFLTRQKTLYERYGPVLSDVTYAGETTDGAIQSTIRTQSWRTDDYVRALYIIQYKVIRPVADIERLAFFQLGADHYNHNLFTTITSGNLDGVVESWTPEMGGWNYSRRGEPLEGKQPWIALTGATKNPPPHIKEGDRGAWANRGLVVRSWNARLRGEPADVPHYSIFGTEDGTVPSAVVELSPPRYLTGLHTGDFLEAEVEMMIFPQRADDYYGPNEALRRVLSEHPDSWHPVHREAVSGSLTVHVNTGTLEHTYPVVVRAGKDSHSAEFSVDGGIGYVPVTITGAATRGPFTLTETAGTDVRIINQSSPAGNDWWQTEYRPVSATFDITFTIPMDGDRKTRTYTWMLANPAEHR